MERKDKLERFTEFLVFGLILGITEDILAINLVTGESFNLRILWIVIAVTVPFAAFSELVVDSEEYKVTEKIVNRLKG
ncbi:hypothetical protein GLU60_01035 [Nanohaloarchaea archaeon H01]|nr:hypothetical protein [Nanohaloarchaea archaeon H01]